MLPYVAPSAPNLLEDEDEEYCEEAKFPSTLEVLADELTSLLSLICFNWSSRDLFWDSSS